MAPTPRIEPEPPVRRPPRKTPVTPDDAVPGSIPDLWDLVQGCRRCDLWRDATQGVAGEGPRRAALMLVGEQPGDQEDLAGQPFVGPAGRLLDKLLAAAGVERDDCYVTNAVKHFKFEPRGKRRLHKSPNTGEIKACRWWYQHELSLVKPKVVVAMGATASRQVLNRPAKVLTERGKPIPLEDGRTAVLTIHPSAALRAPDEAGRARARAMLQADLATAARLAFG